MDFDNGIYTNRLAGQFFLSSRYEDWAKWRPAIVMGYDQSGQIYGAATNRGSVMRPTDHESSDEMLMLRYQRGDRDAFAALVRRYQARVYNFTLRYLKSPSQAEDTAQDVFMRLVQRAGEFKHEARFSTWLFTIARNLCVDQQRKSALRQHSSLDQTASNDTSGPPLVEQLPDRHHRASVEQSVLHSEVAGSILAAIDELPEDQREVFLLREVANLPFKDIAEVTGIGENTLKSRMRYALERLQTRLSEFEEYARALR